MSSPSSCPQGRCALCTAEAELQLSHILPAFVFRWLRESAGNGHLRSTTEPNIRVQDGLKRYMLCASCEGMFSKSEQAFATRLFYPYNEAAGRRYAYSNWLLHFCCSVSWRILRLALDESRIEQWEAEPQLRAKRAEAAWRSYLLGAQPNPGVYRQHILPLDRIEKIAGQWSPNINRYMMRAVHMDLCISPRMSFTYAKLGRFIILGFLYMEDESSWRGTKVHANEGIIEPRKYRIPRLFGGYLNDKAKEAHATLADVSPKQRAKIDAAFRANAGAYFGSDAFIAMEADIERSGPNAFVRADKDS